MVLQPMRGVKVVEVAQFTFVPSAGAVLADGTKVNCATSTTFTPRIGCDTMF